MVNGAHYINVDQIRYPDGRIEYRKIKTYPSGMKTGVLRNGDEVIIDLGREVTFNRVGDVFKSPPENKQV
jgi:hypothetical protein